MKSFHTLLSQSVDMLTFSFIVVDVILIVAAVAFLIWLYIKTSQFKFKRKNYRVDNSIKKIDDETYIIPAEMINHKKKVEPHSKDNVREHLLNPITHIKESENSQQMLLDEQNEKDKIVVFKKEDIGNSIVIDGKNKTSPKISVNRGVSAYQNSTKFIDMVKSETETPRKKLASKRKSSAKK